MLRMILTRKSKGFTLMELVIVMVIVGILATISVPLYTSYVKKAYAAEGHALCDSIAQAEKAYYNEKGTFVTGNESGPLGTITIDTTPNIYFKSFSVVAGTTGNIATSFRITTSGVAGGKASGITITYDGYSAAPPAITITGM
ncbi:MAG: prepilin-type N-terminal cleavage/methylation domain-containing protein [Elusimicrobia bacterium]|nr:prepilin-type N-terminal cleavage/methylation domain-containing protein [Candidatus Liberimonas magnetica]